MFRSTFALFRQAAASSSLSSSSSPLVSTPTSQYTSLVSTLTSHISAASLPPVLTRQKTAHKNLYQHLSTLPNDGVGFKVRQRRWMAKGLDLPVHVDLRKNWREATQNGSSQLQTDGRKTPVGQQKEQGHLCYWEVTRVKLKEGGKHGKAWGRLFWRGKQVTPQDRVEEIRGGLKYCWDAAC